MCITLVRTFLCRRCTTTTWKCLISRRLVEDVNTRQRFSFSLPELRSMQSFRICRIERREKDAVKFETERKSSSETHRHIKGARESLNGRKNIYGTKKSKERREEPLGTMSYQTSSKRSPLFWLLIGARKTQVFWHHFSARLEFPSSPLSAPGSPRMSANLFKP